MASTTSARTAPTALTAGRGRTPRPGAGIVLAALTALTVLTAAGCGSSGEDEPDGGRREPAAESHSPQPMGSPSADRTPSAKPSVTAADGDDVGACADGNCEIAVSKPVTFRFEGPAGAGTATLSVTKVGPNEVEYTVKSDNGQAKNEASGQGQVCITVLRSNGSSNSCGGLGDAGRPSAQPDAVVIQVATGEDGTAILHVVSQ
ncbi:hypothetical protein [Streptomyces sp. F001]|uniref:hypothetical protein n=1 Tax=Streptomyces sp. F001 TaxID=1510026 RepID=UPI001F115792|nr:hypothetical protein [Streptomyces sp. F001]